MKDGRGEDRPAEVRQVAYSTVDVLFLQAMLTASIENMPLPSAAVNLRQCFEHAIKALNDRGVRSDAGDILGCASCRLYHVVLEFWENAPNLDKDERDLLPLIREQVERDNATGACVQVSIDDGETKH